MRARLAILGAAALVMLITQAPTAYWAHGQRWASGSAIVMQLQLGLPMQPLSDGHPSWDAVAAGALASWNQVLNEVGFDAVADSVEGAGLQNELNNVLWGDDVYGDAFGDAIAITKWLYIVPDNITVEADVVFDRARAWDSYRGALRRAPQGGTLNDFRRVALHEFGHALGLGHPDEHEQSVPAIMNRQTGTLDDLQPDDIEGVQSIYGVRPPADVAPPGAAAPPAATDPPAEGEPLTFGRR
ncbi:MAG: hypothetical protein A3F70_05430 [Acidobacteria bacterium RIFCSPLOWO2_12_FULL_67_14]|nr:MAG: hypothetical protein A3H29_07725 [Acidobacteria bacterium RIFCSPLOWO2_02_FULL_67_21]OFW38597.1 MAG: hypothetical protein A3F70_05430 [Acidobacteria bacterium RIFCSPLOWO2_12_FULL_67_14]